MGVEQGQIGKTEEMADLNKNQDPGVDSLSAARPYRPLSLRARLILLLFVIAPLFARLWRSAAFVPAGFLPGTGSGKDGGDHIDGKFFDDAV